MLKIITTMALAVALAAGLGAVARAADTNAVVAASGHQSKAQPATGTWATGWYGPGYDGGSGYFNPSFDEYNPYPYYNIVGGEAFGPMYEFHLPDQNESPLNPAAGLTRHGMGGVQPGYRAGFLSAGERAAQRGAALEQSNTATPAAGSKDSAPQSSSH
jgi:hypothetical protein